MWTSAPSASRAAWMSAPKRSSSTAMSSRGRRVIARSMLGGARIRSKLQFVSSQGTNCSIGRVLRSLLPKREAGAGALPLHLALALDPRAALDVVPLVEHALHAGDRLGRMLGDGGGERQRALLGCGRGRDLVHQAPSQSLLGVDLLAGQEQVLR